MRQITITDSFDQQHTLDLPDQLDEFKLSSKIAFDVCAEDIALWLKESLENETLERDGNFYLYLLCKAISEFLDYPLHKIIRFDVKDLMNEDGSLKTHVLQQHVDDLQGKSEDIDFDSAESALNTIYFYIKKLIDSYEFQFRKEDNYTFEWKGKTWEIPYATMNLLGGKSFSKVSVAQSVNILNIKKNLADINSSKKRTLGDTEEIMNVRFTGAIKIISCTTKLKDEELPLDDIPFQNLVKNRMTEFQDINYKLGMDILFFSILSTKN